MASTVHQGGHRSKGSSSKKNEKDKRQQPPEGPYLLAALTGLLSSSCCLIQLLLNLLSSSCAGFSILDLYRPLFLLLTLCLITATVWRHGALTRPTIMTFLITGLLSASPEVVKLYNEGNLGNLDIYRRGHEGRGVGIGLDRMAVFEVEISGLSCQACANRVKLQIEREEGVLGCDIFREKRRAVVRARPGIFRTDAQLEALVGAAGSGYQGKVVKRYNLSGKGDGEAEENVEL